MVNHHQSNTGPHHQQLSSVTVASQSAATATQSALYHHGFRLNHHHIGAATHHSHHLADVAPSALVMHSGGPSAETMLQLSAVAAATGIDYGSSIGGSH